MRFLKIDELTVGDHFNLDIQHDTCWYMFNYTSKAGYSHSEINSLIINLKKDINRRGTPEYQYKMQAIAKIAGYFSEIECKRVTFVPMPPSKIKTDPLYDDRMVRVLQTAFQNNPEADIRELLIRTTNRTPAHLSDQKRSINQIEQSLAIDQSLTTNIRGTIFLVDDVLTTGASFIAAKRTILRVLPKIHVVGLFVSRRAIAAELNTVDQLIK
jgi:hypothetical protein